jgi:hypothetical protein
LLYAPDLELVGKILAVGIAPIVLGRFPRLINGLDL